jgi:CelD/BcsL family acetyltransferase involved in cellulose biosynthesis
MSTSIKVVCSGVLEERRLRQRKSGRPGCPSILLTCRSRPSGSAALEAVLTCLKKEYPRADWIEWGALRQSSWEKASRNLPGRSRRTSVWEIDGYHLDLPATWEELRASRSRNIKESIRHCYNSLKRDGLTSELRVIQAPEAVPAALATFFRLHTMRSLATNTVAHGDVFRQVNERALLTEYALERARHGELRIFQLLIAGTVVATRVAFQSNAQIYLYFSGYDLEWSKFSVMATLVVEAIKWSIAQRIALLHLSPGTDVSKLRWGPTATRYVAMTEITHRWGAQLSFDTHQRAGRVRRWLETARQPNTTL